ncbi:MAG: LPS export ABC transporter periplasmic protein LptC [Cyclobacteriaceae bacterium]|nr:LPS export ABC transporter periplasmic protein LptC [Cyclobacteriaceae bacterium]
MYKAVFVLITIVLLQGCNEREGEIVDMAVYEGPVRQGNNIDMYYSETALKRVKMKAQKLLEYKNEDREFPEGIYLEFYEEDGTLSSTLRADIAYYSKADNLWKANGDVVVKSIIKDQELKTEELFWKPDEEKIYSDKFVIIRLEEKVIKGTGFESNETFTDYKILKIVDSEISF